MKKLIHALVLMCLLLTVTMVVTAEDADTVTLDLSNGNIVITPDGYQQNDSSTISFSGKYIITGERRSDTPLRIQNYDTGKEVTFDITLDNAKILGDYYCTALRIDGNDPVILNLKTIGECLIRAHNHEAIKSGNSYSVAVKIETDPEGVLTLDRSDYSDSILFGIEGNGTLSLEIDGVNIDANANKEAYSHQHIFKSEDYTPDGNATCKADGTKSARCSANDSCFVFHTIADAGSKNHFFETGICPFCGLHGALLNEDEITWLKYDIDGTSTWFGIDNRNAQFEGGSYFWINYINPTEQKNYWNLLDDSHKKRIEKDNYLLFEIGVAKSNFEEYTQLSQSVPVYVQIQNDWNTTDLKAAYIQDGTDENVTVIGGNKLDYPQGNDSFAKLTLEHFSPYIIYDELTDAERLTTDTTNESKAPKTGDSTSIPMVMLFALLSAVIVCVTKRSYRKTYR